MSFRVGVGYDVHRLVEGRLLILGGVEIAFEKGLLGHSDADVLIHAIIDALLGAAGLGDIGMHFPDSDEKYFGVSSLGLLEKVSVLLSGADFEVINIDSVIVAQAPKLSPYRALMMENIALALNIQADKVHVKAKTEEGLGFTGTGQGIAAHAVCMLQRC